MEIRLLKETDDRNAVSRVYEESWKAAYRGIIPQAYLDSIPRGRWAGMLDTPGLFSLVLLEGGEIVGTSVYCASRFDTMKGYGEIVSIYLLPGYCRRGYGKKLLQTAKDGLARMGYRDVFLWVLEENTPARRFYESCGFVCSGACLEDEIGGRALREVQYVFHAGPDSDFGQSSALQAAAGQGI